MKFSFKRTRSRRVSAFKKYLPIILLLLLTDESDVDDRIYARFDLDLPNMAPKKIKAKFRFQCYEDIVRLKKVLGVPDVIYCENGTKIAGLHALAILLCRLAYPNRWVDNVDFLGRDISQLSRIYNRMLDFLYRAHGHLLENLNQPWLNEARLEEFAAAVHTATGVYDNCWGFIDGTDREICRPRIGQALYYSGKCRLHVIKFQSIVTPDGIIVNLWGPCEGRRHDCYMLNRSNMRERLAQRNVMFGKYYCIYGDKGYAISREIQTPFRGILQEDIATHMNKQMSVARLAVEYGFGKIAQQFAFGSYGKNQRLFWQQVGKQYLVSALMANCHTCMYGFDLVENRFRVRPPSLEQYLLYREQPE